MGNQVSRGSFWDAQSFANWAGLTSNEWNLLKADNCLPTSVFGPFPQSLFLGCSVSNFSCSVGWNEQVSELTVNLVQDPCEGTKVYWDDKLFIRVLTGADPGFIGESIDIIGSPAYFRVGNFEYTGIIQSWEKISSSSIYPGYTVKLVDPRDILRGTQIIIGEYAGGIGCTGFATGMGPYNLFNVYGYLESLGSSCPQRSLTTLTAGNPYPNNTDYVTSNSGPDGSMFGAPANGFGGAGVNNNGMSWNNILSGVNSLVNKVPCVSNVFSPHGRVLFRATNSSFGYGLLPGDRLDVLGPFTSLASSRWLAEYFIDLSEIPITPTYWRLSGSNTSLLDVITQVCEDAGYDYYIELIPVRGVSSLVAPSGTAKFIKIRTVKRLLQPVLGQLANFIDSSEGVVSKRVGTELRNEPTTSFLIGGKKNTYYQIEEEDVSGDDAEGNNFSDNTIIPYFGVDSNEDVIIPTKVEGGDGTLWWHFDADATFLDETLQSIDISATLGSLTVNIGERELQAALGGFDSWVMYVDTMETDTGQVLNDNDIGAMWDWDKFEAFVNGEDADKLFAPDMINQAFAANPFCGLANDDEGTKLMEDAQAIFDWVYQFATEFYGKQYQVRVPYVCARVDSESGQILTSESPTSTGWTDQTYILGMVNGSTIHSYFQDEDGRTLAMVRMDDLDILNVSQLDPDDFAVLGDSYFIKCDVADEYVYTDKSTRTSPRGVISLPAPVFEILSSAQPAQSNSLMERLVIEKIDAGKQADANAALAEMQKNIGNKEIFAPMAFPFHMPDAAGFGVQSDVLTYGPWVTMGPAGTVRVDHDPGLVPWEYGGVTTMNLAGMSKANAGITYQQVSEKGNIVMPGHPILPLGAEIGAIGGNFYGTAGVHLVENRTTGSAGNITVGIGGWVGTYGPNVTSIDVSVGSDGIETTYDFRTHTPKFGNFAKYNANRLREIGKHRLRFNRDLRALQFRLRSRKVLHDLRKNPKQFQFIGSGPNVSKVVDHKTCPHHLLVGSLTDWQGDSKRTQIATLEVKEITTQYENFGTTAFAGWETLIRPVSMDGDGNLPQYATALSGICNNYTPQGAHPVIYKDKNLTQSAYEISVHNNYLNPFSNPAGKERDDVSEKAPSSSDYVGHDMDWLGAESEPPQGTDGDGINMRIAGYNDSDLANYSDDYRMFALRGPLLLQSWGYDLDGKPVPNEVDTDSAAENGTFESTSLTKKFLSKWLHKPHTWPVAPVDLRFDRERGVWVSPPPYRLLYVSLLEDLCAASSAKAQVSTSLTEVQSYDDEGNNIDDGFIRVYDHTLNNWASGTFLTVYYDPYKCEYVPLEGPGLGVYNISCRGNEHSPSPIKYATQIVFGTGIYARAAKENCARVLVDSNQWIGSGNDGPADAKPWETLIFRKNLKVEGNESTCTYYVDASGGDGSGVNLLNMTGCPNIDTPVDGDSYNTIWIGGGLHGTHISDDIAQIDLSFSFGGVDNITNVAVDHPFEAVPTGNCGALLKFDDDFLPTGTGCPDKIWYVTDVYCSGSALVVEKSWLEFNKYGMLQDCGDD